MSMPHEYNWLYEPIYEPKPRMHGGRYGYVRHRFPIKDGINRIDVMRLELAPALKRAFPPKWKLNNDGTLEKK